MKIKNTLARRRKTCYNSYKHSYQQHKKCAKHEGRTDFMSISSIDFATYLSMRARREGKFVNVTKIQKWLYICYGLHLATTGETLFDERPIHMQFGPFFSSVHLVQKEYDNDFSSLEKRLTYADFSQYDEIINTTIEYFGDLTASSLVDWTHEEGKAWEKADKFMPLDLENIRRDFMEIIVNED